MWGVLELQNGKPADFLQRRSNSIKLKKSYHLGRIISGISHSITITPSLQNGSPLHKWQNRVLEFHCQLTNFLYKMSPHYIMTEQGPLNSIVNIPIFINFLYKMSPHYKMKEQGPLTTLKNHCSINLYKISILQKSFWNCHEKISSTKWRTC